MPHVMVISSEGYFYLYSIDLENGGECSLLKQYRYVGILRVVALLIRVFTIVY
jgi:autophagy-related protein 18